MKEIIVFLLLSLNLFANAQNQNYSATTQAELAKIFPKNDAVVENESCSWKCRTTNSNYYTQISGFDFANGITYCRVYEKENLDEPLIYNANKQNLTCLKEIYKDFDSDTTAQTIKELAQKKNYTSQIKYEPKDNQITLSQFLSSLATLNPNIIDREATNLVGELTLKNGMRLNSTATIKQEMSMQNINGIGDILDIAGTAIYNGSVSIINFGSRKLIKENLTSKKNYNTKYFNDFYEETTASDGFNKNNMAYFSDLFMNMEKVYQHLQILLFVVVGGFYISSIGANKLQVYLENRGESASNQPYLHKFYIPLLMVGTFFMPIPEANGTAHSTMVQNTIRYFTTESTKIADMASAIGGKTYMDKIYKSVGGINSQGIDYLISQKNLSQYKAIQAENIYKNTCSKRYEKPKSNNSDTIGYLKLTESEKEKILEQSRQDRQQIAGTEYDITLESCIFLEQEINRGKQEVKAISQKLSSIKNFYNGNLIQNRFKEIDTYFSIRENQLGWINSLITPSSALLAEIVTFAEAKVENDDLETATKKNIENNKRAVANKDVEIGDESDANGGIIGFVMGRLVWMMLPGAENVKKFLDNVYDKATDLITLIFTYFGNVYGLAAGLLTKLELVKQPTVYYLTTLVIEMTFEKVPLLVCTTASAIAFVSYLVSLCKYFYISPFVVAFSMATKRMNKIVDFLVNGIAIFFQPILIVLFIYLALFVHTLINEIFIFLSIEQFTNIKFDINSPTALLTNIVVSSIVGLLKIFGVLASSYIMWKLIVSGSSWAMSLVGIDGKQSDMISQGIEANLAKRAFVA